MPQPEQPDLHVLLNDAIAAVEAMASVLRVIAQESSDPKIVELVEQTLNSPTLSKVLERIPRDAS